MTCEIDPLVYQGINFTAHYFGILFHFVENILRYKYYPNLFANSI